MLLNILTNNGASIHARLYLWARFYFYLIRAIRYIYTITCSSIFHLLIFLIDFRQFNSILYAASFLNFFTLNVITIMSRILCCFFSLFFISFAK